MLERPLKLLEFCSKGMRGSIVHVYVKVNLSQVESVPLSSKQGLSMFVIARSTCRINLRVMLYSSTEEAGGPTLIYAQQPAAYAQQPVVYTQQVSIYTFNASQPLIYHW